MSISPPRAGRIDQSFRHICIISIESTGTTATGMSKPEVAQMMADVPCNLQEMSTRRSMQFKSEQDDTLYDLFLPAYMGTTSLEAVGIGYRFEIDGVVYRSIGKGLRMGTSGKLRVPVQEMNSP